MDSLSTNKPHKAITAFIAIFTWITVILQFFISVPAYTIKGRSLGGAIVQLLSYFTIESNLLIAISLTAITFFIHTKTGRFFGKISTATAIMMYITIVSLVYNIVLRPFAHPTGIFRVDDELLHVAVPILYLLYWLFLLPKSGLKWADLPGWLLFPLFYLFYILIRGAIFGFYPYFFVNVKTFGYGQVVINSVILLVVFAFFGSLFILLGRWISSFKST